jgi:STE24 endopeptidase
MLRLSQRCGRLAGLLGLFLLCAGFATNPPAPNVRRAILSGPTGDREKGLVPVPPPSEDALAFYQTGNIGWGVDTAWKLAIPLILLLTGWAAKLGRWSGRVSSNWAAQTALVWLAFGLMFFLADFPVMFFRSWMRSHWFGLSEQPLPDWALDAAKGCGVELGLGLVLVVGCVFLIRRWPERWWLAAGLLALPLMLVLVFLEPVVVEPLFNRFEPLKDKRLEAKVVALAESAGLSHPVVFQVNRSRQTKALNAYVSGLSGSARIVLWDTLFPKMSEREILSVVAHETGHRVLRHVLKGTVLAWLLVLAGFWGCHRGAASILGRWGGRMGVASLAEPASVVLLVLLFLAAQFCLSPVAFAYSRHVEAEADRFALELTRDNHAGASAQLKLSLQNLSNPRPGWFFTVFRATHPSDASRIEFFNTYKPWESGAPLRYGALIKAKR